MLSLPVISLIALLIAILISCISTLNIGTMSIGFSLIVGHYIGGIKVSEILKGYPTNLLIMLAGTTFLFSIAQNNGTLNKIAKYVIKAVRGNVALLPIVLFFVAVILAAMGPGPTVTAALMAPTVMLLASELGINPLLMAVVVGNGGHAGGMSPIAVGGVIAAGVTSKMGLDVAGILWLNNVIGHFIATIIAYVVFGGLKLWRVKDQGQRMALANIEIEPFTRDQWLTMAGIAGYILAVCFFNADIGMTAFLIGSILTILRVVDEEKAIKQMPWGAILMVTGVTVLVNLMSQVGGMDLFAGLIAQISTPATVNIVAGIIAGIISAYASTTGVVLPAFLPLAPVLLQKIGAPPQDLIPLLSTIVTCGFLVDMSPLSTSGAIYLANATEKDNKAKLFRNMLIWGLSMSVVGAIICWLAFYVLRIP
ncbi:SLC13 family permease [Sporolituus thermophilus]|uniref:Transporter, UIT1 family (TC 9.B.48) n=1 Tax=Sporolituus thermophilus DSM 23256 TaxID=1123285 RepID=A0A1G7NV40_9FIRM|nr:SLC13 family permease [Sporolituus thermophilus]SDF77978.1 transporter, UIT1 family (TC 9.B.48) [Sporolituus thermophilus DSM 23256]